VTETDDPPAYDFGMKPPSAFVADVDGEVYRMALVEYDDRGQRVRREDVERKGLLAVGRRLQRERELDRANGWRHRALCEIEQRALALAEREPQGGAS